MHHSSHISKTVVPAPDRTKRTTYFFSYATRMMHMKHPLTLLLLSLLFAIPGWSQSFDYGNQWYRTNANAPWVKLVVDRDGVYRVTIQDLSAAGFDLSAVDATRLRLFHRGQEVPIHVQRTGTQLVFLEFFGKRNDGRIDSIMYRDPLTGIHSPDLQPNKNLSLFTDESAYFLTWGTQPGQRLFTVFNPAYGQYTPEASFPFEAKREFLPGAPGTEYVVGGGGAYDPFYTLNSDYVTGEGYVGGRHPQGGYFGIGEPVTLTVPTPFAAATGNPVRIRARVFGRSNTSHLLRVDLNGNASAPVIDTSLTSGVYIRTFTRDVLAGATLTANTLLTFSALRTPTDNNNVTFASVTYDRQPNLNGDSALWISGFNKSTEAYFRLTNFAGNDTVLVYDFANRIRHKGLITGSGSGRTANVVVVGFSGARDLFVSTDRGIRKPRIEAPALNKLFTPSGGADFVIITHRGLAASALAYANYRDTATVNPVSVKVVYTDEIYDEYSYGSITPWGIKRFCKYAVDNWTVKPKYFLLWGKGYFESRGKTIPFVPTYGYPATDYEFISHYDQATSSVNPIAAIGRVNIFNDAEGLTYLEKVNEYEHQSWDTWMKQGVFLGGGANGGEQNQIKIGIDQMIQKYQNPPLGGDVFYYQKTSTNTIDPNTATYHDEISKGVGLLHFFGHSTSNIQDISIREPFEYNNVGRYPVMVAMGCYGGDFTGEESFGERWVKTARKGSICYIANSSAGYLNPLRDFGQFMYAYMYGSQFGKSIGELMQFTVDQYTDSLANQYYLNHGRQMNLQGDPAIIPKTPSKPDLEVTTASVYFTPENFSSLLDSFKINVIVQNKGLASAEQFKLSVRQRTPVGSDWIDLSQASYPIVPFRDTFSINVPNTLGNQLTGLNSFDVFADADEVVAEYREDNNRVTINRIVPGNIPAILYPYDFAVIGKSQISLQASAFFISQDASVGYVFEIDTVSTFESPFRVNSGVIQGRSIHVAWPLPFTLEDSTVYYWRVRLANVEPSIWQTASFRYIPNRTGWGQAQADQFVRNEQNRVQLRPLQKDWAFSQFGMEYEVETGPNGFFEFSLNGAFETNLGLSGYYGDGVAFIVLDQMTMEAKYFSEWGKLGVAIAPNELYRLKDAILAANTGDYFIIGSNRNPKVHLWPQDIFDALATLGISEQIKNLTNGQPFLVAGRKGYPGSSTEIYSPGPNGRLAYSNIYLANHARGDIGSPVIGPALRWDNLYWTWRTTDLMPNERADVRVVAIRANGTDSTFVVTSATGLSSIDGLDASRFPFVRLQGTVTDSTNRTAPQLRHWHVFYQPVPEAIIDPITDYQFRSDTVFDGQEVYVKMGSFNISDTPMDSLLVSFTVQREDRSELVVGSKRFAPLPENGEHVPFEFSFNTRDKNLNGITRLSVKINPGPDQPEQYEFNNLYERDFFVVVDKINPILDVTFDGKHIIQNDIVSPTPEILIQVNDENTFVALDDTGAFELYLRRGLSPTSPFERIFVSTDPRVQISTGQLPENKARLFFYPGKVSPLADGNYTLRVQGRDQVGNAAAKTETYYEINFEVVSKSTITQMLNYPNPFSTSTRFVYTLTGSELPDIFQIHIYTVSGKLAKVIDLKEMGDVQFGRNITNYAWDGTDEFGDRLANGVYLYRVVTRYQGANFENRDEGIDQFFNNGWGKMVIMR